jgi:uroporphyrinogen decarboxylase
MMRQAGRYLPEFIAFDKYDFFTRCQTQSWLPKLPCNLFVESDAAILFSDILVIPQAMGIDVEMKPNGPYLPHPIHTIQDVENVIVPDVHETDTFLMRLN